MRRLRKIKIDDASYYENVWTDEYNTRPYYDAVRMRTLIRDVKDGDKVLDVGAGVFGACQYIAEHTKLKCRLYAYDQSYTARDIVKKIAPDITYIIGDCEKPLPFKNKEFDIVIGGEIIEHTEKPFVFLEELKRIGKKVVISTVNTECENAIKHGEYLEHLWEFTKDDLEKHGKYEKCGDYHILRCG